MITNSSLIDFSFQKKAASVITEAIRSKRGNLLRADAGTGKTFAIAQALIACQEQGSLPLVTPKFASILWLTKKNVEIQTVRVLSQYNIKNYIVMSYDATRASFGELFVDWRSVLVRGEIDYVPEWKTEEMPDIIIADEVQTLKNPEALCTKVAMAYLDQGGVVISASATPFSKVCEGKFIAISCGLTTKNNWLSFQSRIAGTTDPTKSSPAAIKRFREELIAANALVEFHGVRFKYKAKVTNLLLEFKTPQEKFLYGSAYERYLEERRKHNDTDPQGIRARWVAMQQFQIAAELLRAPQLAERAVHKATIEDRQVIVASNYLTTLRKVWSTLVHEQGINQDDIAFIVGGQQSAKRQRMVDKFQGGRCKYLLATLKAGGVGLSLHHDRTKNGTRPRHLILPPTWSPFDIIQMLGRAHRITSISDTTEEICWYADTIEEEVKTRMDLKVDCIKELVQVRDTFIYNILNKEIDEELNDMAVEDSSKDEEGEEFSFALEMFDKD